MSKIKIKVEITFVLITIFLLNRTLPVFAARSLTIESYKQNFTNDEEGEIKVVLNDFTTGESIFIKGAFFGPDSTNYFGFTKKGDNWVKNSVTSSDQLSVKIGEWDGHLTVKPDLADTGFLGSGNYNFKVGYYYYTGNGDLSSVNWSDTKSVNITFVPTPTPTPTSTPTPSLTPIPTSVPTSSPTVTAVPTSAPSNTPTVTPVPNQGTVLPTRKPTIAPVVYGDDYNEGAQTDIKNNVLGESVSATVEPAITITEKNNKDSKLSFRLLFILIAGGIVCIGSAIFLSVKEIRKKERIFF